jgi:DNA topoisomerase-1
MNLIIVESPTKAKTIKKFLGKNFLVESSYGHLRDLPKSKLGVDLENDFEPQYVIPRKAQQRVTALKKAAAKAVKTILATDEDREGEAIAWHLTQALKLGGGKNYERIVFHEITESAIKEALKNPRNIDVNLVDAQQARRVLDRLVGYKLSPFLWKKVARGLSAGRVQSVALRLIVEREEEIKSFKPENYWTITATLKTPPDSGAFEANLQAIGGKQIEKPGIKTEGEAKKSAADLKNASYKVSAVEKKELRKNPLPPFITSTLQQTAAQRLGFSAKKTMFLAQSLYENGHITYMRTDSVSMALEALNAAADWIKSNLGKNYEIGAPRTFKSKSRLAQEAHEAVRPTDVFNEPKALKLGKDEHRLYDLIWRRFVASQLPQAVFDTTRAEIGAKNPASPTLYTLTANGNILRFDGFLKIWPAKFEEKELPPLEPNQKLTLEKVNSEAHQTEPPPRYNEASLIKTLEKYGIGRPSTYAPIISVIQDRRYVEKNQGRFQPTEIGTIVNKVLTENFPEIFNVEFTAQMEEELDEIADGEKRWQSVIKDFYDPFSKLLEQKYHDVSKKEITEEKTDQICEKCGKPMVIKISRFGRFLACTGYPECKNTKPLKEPAKSIGMKCPKCGEGDIIERRVSKRSRAHGKIFWGCSRYPDCDYASWTNPLAPKEEKGVSEEAPKEEPGNQ